MGLNVALFNALAPEYENLDVAGAARRDILSTSAEVEIDEYTFGARYDTALALLTAHYMKQNEHGGYAGFQTGETVGDISQSFQSDNGPGVADLGSTIYGEQFLRLRKQLVKTPLIY
jgi:hypothetical protein